MKADILTKALGPHKFHDMKKKLISFQPRLHHRGGELEYGTVSSQCKAGDSIRRTPTN